MGDPALFAVFFFIGLILLLAGLMMVGLVFSVVLSPVIAFWAWWWAKGTGRNPILYAIGGLILSWFYLFPGILLALSLRDTSRVQSIRHSLMFGPIGGAAYLVSHAMWLGPVTLIVFLWLVQGETRGGTLAEPDFRLMLGQTLIWVVSLTYSLAVFPSKRGMGQVPVLRERYWRVLPFLLAAVSMVWLRTAAYGI